MTMFKRIGLFLVVNVLVVITISILLQVLGVRPYLTEFGIDYGQLAAFCLVWGMGGAFISLALSRVLAKMMYGVKVIDPNRADRSAQELVRMVHDLSRAAGLPRMPEVGIYDSPEVNAFATGPTRGRALVAVSTGLLRRMDRDELEGVLGHEVAHVANGDMVTMTLVQGVINAFVMFLARVIAFAITRGDRDSRGTQFLITMVLQVVLSIFGSMVVAWFSRYREYRADAGGARLAGRERMIGALQALRSGADVVDESAPEGLAAFKISGRPSRFAALFSTHPPIEQRIARLRQADAAASALR
jgi:heat shock protein HtpX